MLLQVHARAAVQPDRGGQQPRGHERGRLPLPGRVRGRGAAAGGLGRHAGELGGLLSSF